MCVTEERRKTRERLIKKNSGGEKKRQQPLTDNISLSFIFPPLRRSVVRFLSSPLRWGRRHSSTRSHALGVYVLPTTTTTTTMNRKTLHDGLTVSRAKETDVSARAFLRVPARFNAGRRRATGIRTFSFETLASGTRTLN